MKKIHIFSEEEIAIINKYMEQFTDAEKIKLLGMFELANYIQTYLWYIDPNDSNGILLRLEEILEELINNYRDVRRAVRRFKMQEIYRYLPRKGVECSDEVFEFCKEKVIEQLELIKKHYRFRAKKMKIFLEILKAEEERRKRKLGVNELPYNEIILQDPLGDKIRKILKKGDKSYE